MSRHIAPRQSRRTRKRTRRTIIVAAVLAGVAAIAIALALLRAPITGQLEVPITDPGAVEFVQLDSTSPQGGAGCSGIVANGELDLDITAAPGQRCRVAARIQLDNDGNRDWKVQGVSFNDQTDARFIVGSWSGVNPSIPVQCGTVVTAGTPLRVAFDVTVKPGVAGGTHDASNEAGITVVPADEYNDADCPKPS